MKGKYKSKQTLDINDNKKDKQMFAGGGFSKLLNKDIKELNKVVLTFCCILFLVCVGIISYKTNNSYALFSDSVTGTKTLEVTVFIPKNAADNLVLKVGTSGLETVTHEADSTLQIGTNEDLAEYRYRGGNDVVTNNYVYFNCSDINNQTSSTCELYRIIGIFPTDDGTGNIENRIKLIKAESYGNSYWGSTNWARPAESNITLNETYWSAISQIYQDLVDNAKYYLGGYVTENVKTNEMYQYERKIDESDGGNYFYESNPNSWIGKIALMYASDYGYGASNTCSESTNLDYYDANSCKNNNWLYSGNWEWLLQHLSNAASMAFCVHSSGDVFVDVDYDFSRDIRPVFYLTSDAKFNGIGDGSSSNPYQLKG